MTLLAILFLIMAVGCRAISELANHGKLKWSKEGNGFWDSSSWKRKYKIKWLKSKDGSLPDFGQFIPAPTTYYYKLFNLKYKEAFPLSATFLVFATDGMHAAQAAYHIFLALSLSMFSGESFWFFWPGIPVVHALFYRIFSK